VETPGRLWLCRIGGTGVGYLPLSINQVVQHP
jgi:hypothetical protein